MDEALIKRVPPHSIEAEQSVVGAMLMDRDAITVAAEIICGDDFCLIFIWIVDIGIRMINAA